MKIRDIITELFVKPAPWKWISLSHLDQEAKSIIDVKDPKTNESKPYKLEVSFMRLGPNRWTMAFGVDREVRLTGRGAGIKFTVFATVIDIIKSFLSQTAPDYLTFSADLNESSRIKLYDKIVTQYLPSSYENITDTPEASELGIIQTKTDKNYLIKKKSTS